MPAAVVPFPVKAAKKQATWSLLEIALPGEPAQPLGILLVDSDTGGLTVQVRDEKEFDELDEQSADYLAALASDLRDKGHESGGGHRLLSFLEDSLSGFLRISDRTAVEYSGDPSATVARLFDDYVDGEVRPYETHLPFYGLRAAATKFGEEFEAGEIADPDGWMRAPRGLRLSEGMFVAQVVGCSMEPLIPDGGYCIFRGPVVGSRQGKRLLIEQTGGPGSGDAANRYTVKRYTSRKKVNPDGTWEHEDITLEPLNREFEAFSLEPGDFRVIAEFVQVLPS